MREALRQRVPNVLGVAHQPRVGAAPIDGGTVERVAVGAAHRNGDAGLSQIGGNVRIDDGNALAEFVVEVFHVVAFDEARVENPGEFRLNQVSHSFLSLGTFAAPITTVGFASVQAVVSVQGSPAVEG